MLVITVLGDYKHSETRRENLNNPVQDKNLTIINLISNPNKLTLLLFVTNPDRSTTIMRRVSSISTKLAIFNQDFF